MTNYKHGISTTRDVDISIEVSEAARVHAVIGTAPINLLDDPEKAVNTPYLVKNRGEVKENLGICTNYEDYTLMQATLVSLQKIGTAPLVMINVLDPSKPQHVTAVAGEEFQVTKGNTKVEVEGILLKTLVVSKDDTQGKADEDYVAAFDANGYVNIAVSETGKLKGAEKLTIAYSKLNPKGVTEEDIIGGVGEDGIRTGIELVDEIYSRFQLIPDILTAPGYSKSPQVAAALEMKAELIGELTNAVAIVDIESETTVRPEDVKTAKDKLGCFARQTVACWPKVLVGGYSVYASSVVAAVLQSEATKNEGVPTSPDNKTAPIEGVVLEDGKEIHMTQKQVNNFINAAGVVSFSYLGGWKCWGNNTVAYPDKTEPSNRFIKCVMMSNYIENRFKTEYLSEIGTDGKTKVIDSIVSNFNADLNALVPDYLAGAEVIFDKEENPISEIEEGRFVFKTRYADWTPMEYIENRFTWDSEILRKAFEGGE